MFFKNGGINIPSDKDVSSDEDSHEIDKNCDRAKIQPEPEVIPIDDEDTNTSTTTRKRKVTSSKDKKVTNKRGMAKKNKFNKTTSSDKNDKVKDKPEVGPTLVEDDKEDSQSVLPKVCKIVLII